MNKLAILMEMFVTYGRKPNEAMLLNWLKRLDKFDEETIADAVERSITTRSTPPALSDLIKICQSIKPHSQENKIFCKYCNGDGLVSVYKTVDYGDKAAKLPFAYRCICENGEKYQLFQIVPRQLLKEKFKQGYLSNEVLNFKQNIKHLTSKLADNFKVSEVQYESYF